VARVTSELAAGLDVKTAETRYPSHAAELAADAAADGYDLVLPFGGDGTVNETVNGLMRATVRARAAGSGPVGLPALAPVPAGGANVFAQALGVPVSPVAAARRIMLAATGASGGSAGAGRAGRAGGGRAGAGRAGRAGGGRAGADPAGRTIGLGLAGERYFTFSAGLGLDAEVVSEVDRLRASGRRATPALYMRTTVRRYYLATDRRKPALTLHAQGEPPVSGLFVGVVTNSAPWTYLGRRPVSPVPHPDFKSGLDVFALRRLRTLTTLGAFHQMLHTRDRPPHGRDVATWDNLRELTFRAERPIAFQIDGEYLGETTEVAFSYIPDVLRVLA
jgi:diacylglycerol kinase family enzyme